MNDLEQSCMEMSEFPSQAREWITLDLRDPQCDHGARGALSTRPLQPHLLELESSTALRGGDGRQDMEIRDLGTKASWKPHPDQPPACEPT